MTDLSDLGPGRDIYIHPRAEKVACDVCSEFDPDNQYLALDVLDNVCLTCLSKYPNPAIDKAIAAKR